MSLRDPRLLHRALLGAALLASAAGAQDDPLKVWKKSASEETRDAKRAVKEAEDVFEGNLRLLVRAVAVGQTLPGRVVPESAQLTLEALLEVEDAVEQASENVEAATSAAIGSLPIPPELVAGASRLVDTLVEKLEKVREKARERLARELERALQDLSTRNDEIFAVVYPDPGPLHVPAVAPGQPIEVPEVPLRLLVLITGSVPGTPDDGRLSVGGTADPQFNNGQVQVTIEGPAGATAATGFIDTNTNAWRVDFPQFGPGTLREGNYRVRVDQGGVSATSTIGIRD